MSGGMISIICGGAPVAGADVSVAAMVAMPTYLPAVGDCVPGQCKRPFPGRDAAGHRRVAIRNATVSQSSVAVCAATLHA